MKKRNIPNILLLAFLLLGIFAIALFLGLGPPSAVAAAFGVDGAAVSQPGGDPAADAGSVQSPVRPVLFLLGGIFACLAATCWMNTNFVPGPLDEKLRAETAATKTADFNGTTFDFGSGNSPGGVGQPTSAVIQATALDLASTDETYKFKVQESDDNSAWVDSTAQVSITAVGVIAIPFFRSKRYARANLDVGGTTPSITYDVWFVPHQ